MLFQRFGDRYQIRIERGESVADSFLRFLGAQGIRYASMTGLGAVSFARFSYWNSTMKQYETHEFDEQLEVVSFVGNASVKDGAPFVHAHIAVGRSDLSVIGGHFNDAIAYPTVEIALRPESGVIQRVLDPESGLYVMDLPDRL